MSKIPCEKCPVRLALEAEKQNPGELYKLQLDFADAAQSAMGYTSAEYDEYLHTVSDGIEISVNKCPGISKPKYYLLGKIGIRFMRYSSILLGSTMPNSMEAGVICNNPYLADRPSSGNDCTQAINSIWIEF